MAGETKERILNTALALFSQRGYLGTSMSDIANELGMTKGALYKHYTSKQEILDRITARMGELDQERAKAYQMPDAEPDGFAEAYQNTPAENKNTTAKPTAKNTAAVSKKTTSAKKTTAKKPADK